MGIGQSGAGGILSRGREFVGDTGRVKRSKVEQSFAPQVAKRRHSVMWTPRCGHLAPKRTKWSGAERSRAEHSEAKRFGEGFRG